MKRYSSFACVIACASVPAVAGTIHTIDFEDYDHGEVIANSDSTAAPVYEVSPGIFVEMTVRNFTGPNLAVAFDSQSGDRDDRDLWGPGWDRGNLADDDTVLGNLLIVQENSSVEENRDGQSGAGIGDIVDADDEGSRPGGFFDFYFPNAIDSLGFDLIDIEADEERDSGYVAVLFSGNTEVGEINFSELNFLLGPNLPSGSLTFGDNSANRVEKQSIAFWTQSAPDGSVSEVDRIRFFLNGSGAVDNITFTEGMTATPSPTAALAGAIGLGGLLMRRRRR